MKVFLIYDFLTEYGGLERLIVNHARMLKEEGFEVEILTCHYNQDVVEKMGLRSFKITNISRINSPYESLNLFLCYLGFNKLNELKEGLFLSYSFPCNFMIRRKRAKRVNYINHFPHFLYFKLRDKIEWASSTHGVKRKVAVMLSFLIGPYLKLLDKRLVKLNDLSFTNCNFTKKGLDKLYNIKTILSYPVLDPVFEPSKNLLSEKYIFSSSRIIPGKKYEWLIKSCAYMKKKIPLYISGQYEESYKNSLEALAKRKGVKIKFLGSLSTEELIMYYSSAVAFAFPTPYFEFGLVPAESLACGTPIVVWGDGGGQNEQVIHGVNGYEANPHNLKDFARKLDLLADGNFKKKNKNKILNSAERFSYEEIKKSFIKEISKVLI